MVCAAIKAIYHLVIACALLLVFTLVGYFLTVVLSWFLRVVVPMAWS